MRRTLLLGLGALACVLPLTACEEDDDLELIILRAALSPLNTQTFNLSGTADIEIDRGLLRAQVNTTGFDSVTHIQFVGNGLRCPTASDDINADGNIDIQEGMAAFGNVLFALDTTLTINEAGLAGEFPLGVGYSYSETGVFSTIENSLRPTPGDNFTASLAAGETFDPEGMPVVVLGVDRILPRTVATLPGFVESETLPVACGILQRVNNDDD